jgi:hypothetical protein
MAPGDRVSVLIAPLPRQHESMCNCEHLSQGRA